MSLLSVGFCFVFVFLSCASCASCAARRVFRFFSTSPLLVYSFSCLLLHTQASVLYGAPTYVALFALYDWRMMPHCYTWANFSTAVFSFSSSSVLAPSVRCRRLPSVPCGGGQRPEHGMQRAAARPCPKERRVRRIRPSSCLGERVWVAPGGGPRPPPGSSQ